MMERTLDQVITLIDEGLFSREDEDSGELLSITPVLLSMALLFGWTGANSV